MHTDLDPMLTTADVERVTGYSRRWISHLIQIGDFPAPDAPARKRGASNRWRQSTIRRALDEMQAAAKRQPSAAA